MTWVNKKPFKGRNAWKKLVFDKFCLPWENVSGAMRATVSKNCDCSEGILRAGFGASLYTKQGASGGWSPPANTDKICIVESGESLEIGEKSERLYYFQDNGKAYEYDEETSSFIRQGNVAADSRCVMVGDENRGAYVLISAEDGYNIVRNGVWEWVPLERATTAVCVCKGRVFLGLRQHELWYSSAEDVPYFAERLEDTGRISLAYDFGEIVALLTYQNKVFVFQEYGVLQVDVSGSPLDFKITPLDYAGGRILGGSVGVCNGKVLFLTEKGMVRFNGRSFEHVYTKMPIRPATDSTKCSYAVCGDRYFVRYMTTSGEYTVAALSADEKSGYFLGDRIALSECRGEAMFTEQGCLYTLREDGDLTPLDRFVFEGEETDLGTQKPKRLKKLRLEGEGYGALAVYCDGNVWAYSFTFDGSVAEISLGLRAKKLKIVFFPQRGMTLRKMTVEYAVV